MNDEIKKLNDQIAGLSAVLVVRSETIHRLRAELVAMQAELTACHAAIETLLAAHPNGADSVPQ